MIPTQFLRKPNRPLCIAHRGASALAPENTLASFIKAIDLGADVIEFDVQLTQDNVPVVFHDEGLERTTDDWGDLDITTLEDLRLLDAGKWFSSSFKGEKVPSLDEAFHTMAPKVLMYLELKHQKKKPNSLLVEKVVQMIKEKDLYEKILVVSFDLEIIDLVKQADAKVVTGANFIFPDKVMRWLSEKPDRIDVLCPRISVLNDEFLNSAAQMQKPVYAWNSDKTEVLKKWGDHPQIHGLATNNPETFFSAFPK